MRLLLGATSSPLPTSPVEPTQAAELGAGGGIGSQMWQLLGMLVIFAAIMGLSLWLLRWFGRRSLGGHGRVLQVVERAPLTREASVVIVRAAERHLLLGVTKEHVSLLKEWPEGALAPFLTENTFDTASSAGETPVGGFWSRFGHNLLIASGLKKGEMARPPRAGSSVDAAETGRQFQDYLAAAERGQTDTVGSPIPPESGHYHVAERGRTEKVSRTSGENSTAQKSADAHSVLAPHTRQAAALRYNSAAQERRPEIPLADSGAEYVPSTARKPERGVQPDGAVDEMLDKISKRSRRYQDHHETKK